MLSAGILSSLRHALVDGPALLALAGCLALLESGHRRASLVAGAVAGLTRETALLGAAALAPASWRDWRGWGSALFGATLMGAPLIVWMWHLRDLAADGAYHGGGFANFTWPFAGFVERWAHLVGIIAQRGWLATPGYSLLLHAALTVQAAYIVAVPRWRDLWWRVGACHVLLLASLNTQVWEDYPGAAPRVLLPLALVFNRLVPAGGRWTMVLLAGNLTFFAGFVELREPPREISVVEVAPGASAIASPEELMVEFADGFHVLEGSGETSWRWTSGDAQAMIINRTGRALHASLEVTVRSRDRRSVVIRAGGAEIAAVVADNERRQVQTREFLIPSSGVHLDFRCGDPGVPPAGDARRVALEVSGFRLRLR